MARFKQEILDKIINDPDLFAIVAKTVGLKPTSMAVTIRRNGNSLNQYSVIVAVAEYLDKEPEELLEIKSKVKGTAKVGR